MQQMIYTCDKCKSPIQSGGHVWSLWVGQKPGLVYGRLESSDTKIFELCYTCAESYGFRSGPATPPATAALSPADKLYRAFEEMLGTTLEDRA